MRKNTQQVWEAWKKGKSLDKGSIRTDGRTIFSYATPIFLFNRAHYSNTTTRQQRDLHQLITMDGWEPKF